MNTNDRTITIVQNDNQKRVFPLEDNVTAFVERITKEFQIHSKSKWHFTDGGNNRIDLKEYLPKIKDSTTLFLHRSDIGTLMAILL
jgi:hypothetical protein